MIRTYTFFKTALLFGAVLFLGHFTDFWTWLIDPQLESHTDPVETAKYWEWWYTALYILLALPWFLLSRQTGYTDRLSKAAYLFIGLMFALKGIDLWISGNEPGYLLKPIVILVAFLYTLVVWFTIWRDNPKSAPIESGKVYEIYSPPSTMLQFLGSIIFARWAGTVCLYSDGYTYGYGRKVKRFEIAHVGKLTIRPGQVARLTGANPINVHSKALAMQGKRWRWDCFRVRREILS